MAFNDGFYWYKNVLKKQLKLASRIYLSVAIVLAPIFLMTSANASTLAGGSGWRVASTVANGIGVTVNGVKDIIVNGASKTVTGVANVTPTASQVGKFMGKNLGAAAVIGAMDLLLDGVDYVLDPSNNSVIYKPKIDQVCTTNDCNNFQFFQIYKGIRYSTANAACNAYKADVLKSSASGSTVKMQVKTDTEQSPYYCSGTLLDKNGGLIQSLTLRLQQVINPNYDGSQVDSTPKSLPLVNLGSQVLDKAEEELRTGNPAVPVAMPVTQAAARAAVQEAEVDEPQARPIVAELDKSASIPTDQTAVGEIAPPTTNPETGQPNPTPLSLEFPVFCSWAPSMCILADKVQQAITDATDWATSEPQQKDPENLDFEDLEIDASDVNLSASSNCPQDSVSFSVMGKSVTLDMPYQPVCDALNFFKPAVLLVGAVASVYIVAGVRTKEEDQA